MISLPEGKKSPRIIAARYLRGPDRRPFGLVVYDGKNFGWSLCHPGDRFSKRKAWLIAVKRLDGGFDCEADVIRRRYSYRTDCLIGTGRTGVSLEEKRGFFVRVYSRLEGVKFVMNQLRAWVEAPLTRVMVP